MKERKEIKCYRVKGAKIPTGDFRVLIIKKEEHLEQHKLSFLVLGAQFVKPVAHKEK